MIKLIFNLIFNLMINFFLLGILISQYYSLKRFLLVLKGLFLQKVNLIIGISYLIILIIFHHFLSLVYLLDAIFCFFFFAYNHFLHFKWTRRNIFLMMLIIVFSFFFPPYYPLTNLIIIVISYYLLWPLEKILERYYLKKAKKKLQRINPLIIGISGSNGKTSMKMMLKHVLGKIDVVSSTEGNINTYFGVMKWINQKLSEKTKILILELGIDEKNGMDKFARYLHLDYAIITSISKVHLATFKSLENIYQAKLKIASLLKNKNNLLLNKDDIPLINLVKIPHLVFSARYLHHKEENLEGISFTIQNQLIHLPLYGNYHFAYLDGIKKLMNLMKLEVNYFIYGVSNLTNLQRRLKVQKYKNGYLIDDSYNCSLNSVKASLHVASFLKGKTLIVTSGIIEQGGEFVKTNLLLQDLLKGKDVLFIGKSPHPLLKNHHFASLIMHRSATKAYDLINHLPFDNYLILASGEEIYLH